MPSPDLKRLQRDVLRLVDILESVDLRLKALEHIAEEHLAGKQGYVTAIETLAHEVAALKRDTHTLSTKPIACVYETRPVPFARLQATSPDTSAAAMLPSGSWCRTHGWDCPNAHRT